MSGLIPLPFSPVFLPLPDAHRTLAVDALDRAAGLCDTGNPERCPGFVMTPPHVAWSLIVAARGLVPDPGAVFCEWGAGIGLVTLLAARAGFDAWGVELEPGLIAVGAQLAEANGASCRLVAGSYKPAGFFEGTPTPDPGALRIAGRDLVGEGVTFVYAWPVEAAAVCSFFANHAPPGAVLILYQGGQTVSAWRQSVDPAANSAASPLR